MGNFLDGNFLDGNFLDGNFLDGQFFPKNIAMLELGQHHVSEQFTASQASPIRT